MPRPGGLLRAVALALALTPALAACGSSAEPLTLLHDGLARTAVIDRPAARGPAPLIIVLHGALLDGAAMRGLIGLAEEARAAGAALAWPDAHGPVWNDLALAATLPAALSAPDDIGFLDALIDRLVAGRVADPARVHLVGISNGGMMAFAYACQRADRLASLVVFKATMAADAASTCRPERPLPVLIAAGTEDPIVRWDGRVMLAGLVELTRRMPVEEGFALWRARNGCAGQAAAETLPRRGGGDAPRIERSAGLGCAAETVLYAIVGGGHRLPGGEASFLYRALGPASPDAEAAALILGFTLPKTRP